MEKFDILEDSKIAIIGSEGYIGKKLSIFLESYFQIIQINRNSDSELILDLNQPNNFDYSVFDTCKYVIIAAAISSPDYCEKFYEKAYNTNVIGTKTVIERVMQHNCKVIFLSSDAVYGQDVGRTFNENSFTDANTAYGKMKKEIEDIFVDEELFKSVRLSYVISREDKFMKYIDDCLQNDIIAEIFHPFYRNCVTLDEVIHSIIWLIENWDKHKSPFLNICGQELISRLRIVDEINRFSDKKINYKVIYPGENFFKVRPEITEMSSLYIGEIIEEINDLFSIRLKRELAKNNL